MFKFANDESEWNIFQNVIKTPACYRSKKECELFEYLIQANWLDNTRISRPDFISDNVMIEMFELDDIVSKKRGADNPQRKADGRALRDAKRFLSQAGLDPTQMKIIANGDTRYNPKSKAYESEKSTDHHNYQAYLDNFRRICGKHLESVNAYRKNFPQKKLGFLIVDDATFYVKKSKAGKLSKKQTFYLLPQFDTNFMRLFAESDVDFVLWAFNNKYVYTKEDKYGQDGIVPSLCIIAKENYYGKHSRKFDTKLMCSLEK